jgi:FMN phosphatase YigB (HAD superfamily)
LGKPRQGWGGKGHVRLDSPIEWLALDREELRSGYVWQPYLVGADEFSVDFAIDFQGRLSVLSIRKRVRTIGGFAVIAAADDDAQLAALAQRLAELTAARGGCGIFNAQVLSHRARRYVSDVNARIGTSAVFAYEEGVNLPLFVCGLAPQTDVPPIGRPRTGMPRTMVRRLAESFYVPTQLDDVVAVVFDLDDTLLKHKAWMLDKVERAHAKLEGKLPPLGDFLAKALELLENGQRHRLFDALADEFCFSHELKQDLIESYRAAVPARHHLFADVPPVLTELRARGLKVAVLTDNPPTSQRQKVAGTGLSALCDEVVFSREAGGEKPATNAFHEVARRLGTSCDRLVMVGDDLFRDVRGALAAGYTHAFLVQREGGFCSHDLASFRRVVPEATQFTLVPGLIDLLAYVRPGPLTVSAAAANQRAAT